jgi:hypothetical protein
MSASLVDFEAGQKADVVWHSDQAIPGSALLVCWRLKCERCSDLLISDAGACQVSLFLKRTPGKPFQEKEEVYRRCRPCAHGLDGAAVRLL